MVFGFDVGGKPIGTIRIVPMGYRLTLTETLLAHLGHDALRPASGHWDVGRLVLAPEYRSDVNTLRHCLFLALSHARDHTNLQCLQASCNHVLARLYRRFGFSPVARDVPLAGTEKTYTLISGGVMKVLKGLGGGEAGARPQ